MNIIEINNLNYSYKDKIIFENLCLNIKNNSFTTILGPNGSGKTTLARLIANNYQNIKVNTKKINYVYSNPNEQIIGKTVKEQLMFYIKKTNLESSTIKRSIDKIIHEFKLRDIIDIDPYKLDNEQKQIVLLLSNILAQPDLLILDDALSYISSYYKTKILKYLKRQKITIINFTNDVEESIYSQYIIIINKKVIINKTLKKVLKEEKKFIDNNLQLPFMAELSLKLKYYEIIDDITLNINELVNNVWS